MFRLAFTFSVLIYRASRYLPGNLLRAWLRSERGFRYALPASLLAAPYWLFTLWLFEQIRTDDVGRWASIFVLGFGISAFRFVGLGIENLFLRVYRNIRIRDERCKSRREKAPETGASAGTDPKTPIETMLTPSPDAEVHSPVSKG